ncbi:hypothetical protein E2C01_009160 [Portunus trituberculatus]|uniref:Uncharacterized protein n=1 Tax=Portunus trituberculatus TaxID=210409 RepID=A0A5B7D2Q5_PORTR|nr:hypothetical protein [Portunus trituberculatus]
MCNIIRSEVWFTAWCSVPCQLPLIKPSTSGLANTDITRPQVPVQSVCMCGAFFRYRCKILFKPRTVARITKQHIQ